MAGDGESGLTVLSERTFEHDGATWRVREVREKSGIRSLVFEQGGATRTLRGVPSDWHKLDEEALVLLSGRR